MAKKERPVISDRERDGLDQDEYGWLTPLHYYDTVTVGAKTRRRRWWCRCRCGMELAVAVASLKNGNTTSCGCFRRLATSERAKKRITHGCRSKPEYRAWVAMRDRCSCKSHHAYGSYGGRGIVVCEGWRGSDSFENFYAIMGDKPTLSHSIDRIDNNKGYDCGQCGDCKARKAQLNCRWATWDQQSANRRSTRLISYKGETLCLAEWARRFSLNHCQLSARLKRGWTMEKAESTPVDSRRGYHR